MTHSHDAECLACSGEAEMRVNVLRRWWDQFTAVLVGAAWNCDTSLVALHVPMPMCYTRSNKGSSFLIGCRL